MTADQDKYIRGHGRAGHYRPNFRIIISRDDPNEYVIMNRLLEQAELHYVRAIRIYENSFGPGDANVSKTKNNLVGC